MGIVERIRQAAAEKDLNLAKIERILGFGNSTIRKWDQNSPSLDKVIETANLLEKPLSWIATGEYGFSEQYSDFLNKYEQLSDLDKKKIDYFMEISLITNVPSSMSYNIKESATANVLREATSYYHSEQDSIAVLGYVAAGIPIEGISIPLGYISPVLPADYALIAQGHSMEPVIQDGEYIYVKGCDALHSGDIGIFYIDGEVTCKKYHPCDEYIVLDSLNPDFKPFKFSLNEQHDFKIQGKVILTEAQKSRHK